MTTANATRRVSRPAACNCQGNTCRWLAGNEESRARLLNGEWAMLWVHAANPSGHVDSYFYVECVRDNSGQTVAYKLHKEERGQIIATYFVDISFGVTDLQHWTCDCWSAKKSRLTCKHCKALFAALTKIDLIAIN